MFAFTILEKMYPDIHQRLLTITYFGIMHVYFRNNKLSLYFCLLFICILLCWIAFVLPQKQYRVGLLFWYINMVGAAPFLSQSEVALFRSAVPESHISDSCSHYSGLHFVGQRNAVRNSENIALVFIKRECHFLLIKANCYGLSKARFQKNRLRWRSHQFSYKQNCEKAFCKTI